MGMVSVLQHVVVDRQERRIIYFLGETDSSSMVDSSSPSRPKRSLLCFCGEDSHKHMRVNNKGLTYPDWNQGFTRDL